MHQYMYVCIQETVYRAFPEMVSVHLTNGTSRFKRNIFINTPMCVVDSLLF